MKQRIQWLDAAKCFGIFAIYWGHYGVEGYSSDFVFQFHVPFLFLLSGCSEYLHKDDSIRLSLKKIFRGLLIPWLVFCVLSVVTYILQSECELYTLWPSVWKILQGTPRNTFVGYGLWFLTCLAVVKILFAVLRRIKNRWMILLLCVMIYGAAAPFVDISNPMLPFNADIALYYLLYFGIGYAFFPNIQQLLQTRRKPAKMLCGISFCICAGFCAYLYFGRNLLDVLHLQHVAGGHLQKALTVLMASWLMILLGHRFQDVDVFQKIGRNTLYLCGSEHPVRVLRVVVFDILDFSTAVPSSLYSLISALLTLWGANQYLVPMEKRIVSEIQSAADFLCGLGKKQS